MELTQAHLDRLVCPVCYGPLRLTPLEPAAGANAGSSRAIECAGCGRRFPFHDGLPVLIGTRATRMSPPEIEPV